MPVKMIAVGRYYDTHTGKEYKHNAEFHVPDDKTADRLERIRKAKRAHPHVAPVVLTVADKPQIRTRVMTPEPMPEPVVVVPEPYADSEFSAPAVEPEPVAEVAKIPTSRLGRYRRNDMRSED